MMFNKLTIDLMKKRQSIRNFDTQNIKDSHVKDIKEYITNDENLVGPFGNRGRIEFIPVTNNVSDKGIKLGTYGFIKNPQGYLAGVARNSKYSLVEFAYTFQKLVIWLTGLEVGTCWMGGTFNRNSFEKEIQLGEGEFIPCITPIGYPNQKQRVFDKALRYVVKADNKKPWDQLFYDTSFEVPLKRENAGSLELPIEMVRLGPSASNKQPWRLLMSSDREVCHFYIEHTPNYSSKLGYDMQLLDMGIAMGQFELACKELEIQGHWSVEEPSIQLPTEHTEYIVSWNTL
ncbi:nitroreductase family protein [Neobacillus niacini]|uniref:nitroreductase family protein n=1 Tax=Neobacillus niacini TaxID=86668 RepID=UPI0007ABEBEF|nr:nitroreductase family protein [Neobacillus niacini]MEC1523814.1 nitroreductase family protein [Neobacillus niacini]